MNKWITLICAGLLVAMIGCGPKDQAGTEGTTTPETTKPEGTTPTPDATKPEANAPAPDATKPEANAPAPDATKPEGTAPVPGKPGEKPAPTTAPAPTPEKK